VCTEKEPGEDQVRIWPSVSQLDSLKRNQPSQLPASKMVRMNSQFKMPRLAFCYGGACRIILDCVLGPAKCFICIVSPSPLTKFMR
jgi:hypothetical protein